MKVDEFLHQVAESGKQAKVEAKLYRLELEAKDVREAFRLWCEAFKQLPVETWGKQRIAHSIIADLKSIFEEVINVK